MELFDYRNTLLRLGPFTIEGRTYSSDEVIEKLKPLLTEARMARIDKVVERRTWSVGALGESLYDIGNISAVMRSAESFGFLKFHLIERPGAKYKKSDRISRGSEKWLDIQKYESSCMAIKDMQEHGYQVVATTLKNAKPINQIDFSKPTMFLFGNEKDGVSKEAIELADECAFIPMLGFTESFNISVAAAISFYHAFTERRRLFDEVSDLTNDEKLALKAQYYMRSVGSDETISALFRAARV